MRDDMSRSFPSFSLTRENSSSSSNKTNNISNNNNNNNDKMASRRTSIPDPLQELSDLTNRLNDLLQDIRSYVDHPLPDKVWRAMIRSRLESNHEQLQNWCRSYTD